MRFHPKSRTSSDQRPGPNFASAPPMVAASTNAVSRHFNADWEPLEFELSPIVDSAHVQWRHWIDTSLDSPHDIVECEEEAPTIGGYTYRTGPRSVVMLFAALR